MSKEDSAKKKDEGGGLGEGLDGRLNSENKNEEVLVKRLGNGLGDGPADVFL